MLAVLPRSFLFSSVLFAVGGVKSPGPSGAQVIGVALRWPLRLLPLVSTGGIGVGGACRRDGIACL